MDFEPIEVNATSYPVVVVETGLRNSYARLQEDHVLIKVPRRLSQREKERVAADLYRRIRGRMLRGPIERLLPQRRKLAFRSGQAVALLGGTIRIGSAPALRSGMVQARLEGDSLTVFADDGLAASRFSRTVRLALTRHALPRIEEMVERINLEHFRSGIGRVSLRENSSNWGSCTRGRNNISINFKLLFMPAPILEYVIVHELAHTKIRAHSPRFWELVGRILPDYGERRRWLRENGALQGVPAAPQPDVAKPVGDQPNSPASPLAASASA